MSTPTLDPAPVTFTAQDRCDRCGAQAFVRAILIAGDLLFCAHHGKAYATKLAQDALEVLTTTPAYMGNDGMSSAPTPPV